MGAGYVRFARNHPDLFLLMFRGERLDRERPALRDAMQAAYGALAEAAAAAGQSSPRADATADAAAAWAIAHGLAMLLIDGRLRELTQDTDALVGEALSRLML